MNQRPLTVRVLSCICFCVWLYGCSPYTQTIKPDSPDNIDEQLVKLLEHNYPFTEHKKISWTSVADDIKPYLSKSRVEDLDYLEMRRIIYQLPDARINLGWKRDRFLKGEETDGYIGFDIAFIPPGNYFVCSVDTLSDAWKKGLRVGHKIIGWDKKLISEAINSFPLRWGYHPSTEEARQLFACHFISKGRIGSSVEVFYVNEKENNRGIRLEYYKKIRDDYPDYLGVIGSDKDIHKEFKLLNDSLAYFRIDQFTPKSLVYFNRKVLPSLKNIAGLIIDLRENSGGYDPIAVKIAGYFVSEERFYEEAFLKEDEEIHTIGSLHAHPETEKFNYPIIILTGPLSMGVAEGFAKLLEKEDHVRLLGSWNTAASFSLPGGQIILKDGVKMYYPIGGSMDENHRIIIEAGTLSKGLRPNIYISPSEEMIIEMANGGDVLLMEAVNHIWMK